MVRGKISRREVEDQSAGLEVISLRAVEGPLAGLLNEQSQKS